MPLMCCGTCWFFMEVKVDNELEDLLNKKTEPVKKKPGRPKKIELPEDMAVDLDVEKPKPEPKQTKSIRLRDDRKLTKKHKETLRERWSSKNAGSTRSKMMDALTASAKEKFGVNRVFGSRSDLQKMVIGIPTPSLAFEYLIANDVFPLSSYIMIAGQWATCKSALSYEIFRWFYELNGIVVHIDTEFKFDSDFALSIMKIYDDSGGFISSQAKSTEEVQRFLVHYVKEIKKLCAGTKEDIGPGPSIPAVFCVDSLSGTTSEETQESIIKDGAAGRSFPISALKNSHFIPAFKPQLDGFPFSLLAVNHLKEKVDSNGITQQYTLGGQSYNFHESIEIRNRVWKSNISNANFSGKGILLKCAKNSYGADNRSIRTRFLWYHDVDPVTGQEVPVYFWDWDWSIVTLLNDIKDSRLTRRLKDRGLQIKVKSPAADVECYACFPAIGMGSNEYAPFQEVGRRIQENTEVCNLIRDALDIQRRYVLDRPYNEIEEEHMNKLGRNA